jgi:uncharacterized protein involved in outer membrane biogenesis
MRVLKVLITVLVLLVVAAVVAAFVMLNSLVKTSVETIVPKLTQTTVKLQSVKLSPFSGHGEIRGLEIGNPQGFKTPYAVKLGGFTLDLDPKSVLSDQVIVKQILIEGPEITYEMGLKASNLSRLQENIQAASGGKPGAKPPAETPTKEPAPAKAGKKVLINDLRITGGRINLSAAFLDGHSVPVVLPDVHLQDIGKESGGTDLSQVVAKIVNVIIETTTKSVTQSGKLLGEGLQSATKEVENLGKGTLKGAEAVGATAKEGAAAATGAAEEGAKAVNEAAKSLIGGVKGILGGKDSKPKESPPPSP